jgi:hypothetical protein
VLSCCRVVEGVAQAVRPALAASLPVELQARLAGTPHPTSGQVRSAGRLHAVHQGEQWCG